MIHNRHRRKVRRALTVPRFWEFWDPLGGAGAAVGAQMPRPPHRGSLAGYYLYGQWRHVAYDTAVHAKMLKECLTFIRFVSLVLICSHLAPRPIGGGHSAASAVTDFFFSRHVSGQYADHRDHAGCGPERDGSRGQSHAYIGRGSATCGQKKKLGYRQDVHACTTSC